MNEDSDIDANDLSSRFSNSGPPSPRLLGDGTDGRAIHGYTDEIAAYNAKRPCLHAPDAIPATSVLLSLRVAKDLEGGPNVLAAQDTARRTFYPVLCVYDKLYPKIQL